MTVLRELADRGTCIVMVEHRLGSCLSTVDRLVRMEDGQIIADEAAAEVNRDALRDAGFYLPLTNTPSPDLLQIAPQNPVNPSGQPLLEAQGLRYQYPNSPGEHVALDDVSIQLFPGERVALLGTNGAGKSTLLSALSGCLQAGPIRTQSKVIDVPQDPDLALFCATVEAELAYGARDHGLPQAEINQRVQSCAQALSITDLLHRVPQALSRGQRLRVAVAACLACSPQVLILDEPTAGQDREQVERMMQGLRQSMAHGALLFATHDLSLAQEHATRILVVDQGQIVAGGLP